MGNWGHSPADHVSAHSGAGWGPAASFLNTRQPQLAPGLLGELT